MSNDVKLEQAADEAARSALSEEWPGGYDFPEREAFKAGFLAGARYQLGDRLHEDNETASRSGG